MKLKDIKQTRDLLGMTITVEISDGFAKESEIDMVFAYFESVEKRFSVFKDDSEITLINKGELSQSQYSKDMKTVFALAEKTKKETNGYFDIVTPAGKYNPSGLVKGWAIYNASLLLLEKGFKNFYVEAGGDIQAYGLNGQGTKWSVGIQNPFDPSQIVKVIRLKDMGIATSGSYRRGQHIYDPHNANALLAAIVSISVIGPNVYEADKFATAAFAMGAQGINFIENLKGFEGYMIDKDGMAIQTSDFVRYL
jgi:FAD:protein FMN transferase